MNDTKKLKCEQCIHRDCCAYKETYSEAVKTLADTFANFYGSGMPFMELQDPKCKLFLSNTIILEKGRRLWP